MRKILLILFLYSLLSGTAFAKVEIWECILVKLGDVRDFSYFPKAYIKIDTKGPKVFRRIEGKWVGGVRSIYDKDSDTVIYEHGNGKTKIIYDLITNTYETYHYNGSSLALYLKYECEEID